MACRSEGAASMAKPTEKIGQEKGDYLKQSSDAGAGAARTKTAISWNKEANLDVRLRRREEVEEADSMGLEVGDDNS
jgi:hypothetical protein